MQMMGKYKRHRSFPFWTTSAASHPAPEDEGITSQHSCNPNMGWRQEGCPVQSVTNDRFPHLRCSFTLQHVNISVLYHSTSHPKNGSIATFVGEMRNRVERTLLRGWGYGIWPGAKVVTAQPRGPESFSHFS